MVAVAEEGGVSVDVAQEGFLAGRRQLHRAARLQRQQAERELEALVLAVGGGAGDSRDDHLHPLRFQAVTGGGRVAIPVGVRRRQVQLHTAVGTRYREARLRADGGGVLAADPVEALDDDLAGRVRVAVAQRDVPDQVAVGVQRFCLEGLLGVGHRVEYFVLDDDRRGGHARGVGVVGGDGGDGLPVVAYDLGGEHRAVGPAPAVQFGARHVLVRDDGPYAGHVPRVGGVDGEDARVRVR